MSKKKKVSLSESIPKVKKVVETKAGENRGYKWHVQTAQYSPLTEIYASLCEDLIKAKVLHSVQWEVQCHKEDDDIVIRVWYSSTHRCTYHIEAF